MEKIDFDRDDVLGYEDLDDDDQSGAVYSKLHDDAYSRPASADAEPDGPDGDDDESDESEGESFCAAGDSPYEHMRALADLMQTRGFMASDGSLTPRAVELIKATLEACWSDPHDGPIFNGTARWLQGELNAVRTPDVPEIQFQYYRSHTTSPLKGPDIFHPSVLIIRLRSGERFRTTNSVEIDR